MRAGAQALVLCLALAAPMLPAAAQGLPGEGPRARVFDLPVLARGVARIEALALSGEGRAALSAAERLVARFPELGALRLLIAEAALADGRRARARSALGAALALGVTPTRIARARGLAALLEDPLIAARLAQARERPRPPPRPVWLGPARPGPVRGGVALVTPDSTEWRAAQGRLVVRVAPPPADQRTALVAGAGLAPGLRRRLAGLVASGRAAGHAGDLYDNHDRDHSTLARELFPQLTFVEYGPEARARRLDFGAVTGPGFDRPVFGNSSTAITGGRYPRSQPRQLLTQPGGPGILARQYASNEIYVYPEHRDHDPATGDLFPANTPYVLISQGSSGSDRAFLRAVGVILAALPPGAKTRAAAEGLIAPLVQKVIREGMAPEGGYRAGAAHPSVFDGGRIDLDRLVDIAQRQSAATLPPMVRLRVLWESGSEPGRTRFAGGLSETLFDTPSAIARIHRRTARWMELRISAAATRDPNGRPLRFAWRVLRGDPARISIEPDGEGARVATLRVAWHDPYPVPGDPERSTHRVDIGVFAHNGAEWSAPAFVSIAYPPLERRRYARDGRVLEIAYPGLDAAGHADPRLFPRQGWVDRYRYGADAAPLGWTRRRGDEVTRYTPAGLRVVAEDRRGRVVASEPVRYALEKQQSGLSRVTVTPAIQTSGPGAR